MEYEYYKWYDAEGCEELPYKTGTLITITGNNMPEVSHGIITMYYKGEKLFFDAGFMDRFSSRFPFGEETGYLCSKGNAIKKWMMIKTPEKE